MKDLKIQFSIAGLFVVMLLAGSIDAKAQVHNDLKSILTNKQWQKYQKGERLIEKGRMLIYPADSGNISRSDTKQYKREQDMKKHQANMLINDGLTIKMKALEDHIDGAGGKEQNEKVSARLDELMSVLYAGKKKSKKLYGRSDKTPDISRSVKYQDDAIKEKEVTIASVEKGLLGIENIKEEEPSVVQQQTVAEEKVEVQAEPQTEVVEEVVKTEAPVVAEVAVAETTKAPVVKEETKAVPPAKTGDVYFTIQIMADKVRVSKVRLNRVYNGSRKIIENMGDGWFRYSVGKFGSYSKAASTMKQEGIKGYVVAYKGSKRISVSEAKRLLGGVNR